MCHVSFIAILTGFKYAVTWILSLNMLDWFTGPWSHYAHSNCHSFVQMLAMPTKHSLFLFLLMKFCLSCSLMYSMWLSFYLFTYKCLVCLCIINFLVVWLECKTHISFIFSAVCNKMLCHLCCLVVIHHLVH